MTENVNAIVTIVFCLSLLLLMYGVAAPTDETDEKTKTKEEPGLHGTDKGVPSNDRLHRQSRLRLGEVSRLRRRNHRKGRVKRFWEQKL